MSFASGIWVGLILGVLFFWRPARKWEITWARKDVAFYKERLEWWAGYAGTLARRVAELEDVHAADWWKEDE